MPATRELLFGRIAVAQGYCTQEQLDDCLKLQLQRQSPHRPAPRLGELMVEQGALTAEQCRTVLDIQAQNTAPAPAAAPAPAPKVRTGDALFGKVVVREKMATQAQVNECIALRNRDGETRTLGEILVDRGYMTADLVKQALSHQLKRIMHCAACGLSFTVLSLSAGKSVECPRCRGPLSEGKPSESTRTDAEFATQVIRAVKAGLPASPPERPTPRPSARRVKASCVICDHEFETGVGPDGRVQCPQCHTTFPPR